MKVIINAAMSLDGKIDTVERRGASLSSSQDKRRVLELRASVDAVMVGGNTLRQENPKLTVKLPELEQQRILKGLPPNPAKVAISTRAELDLQGDFVRVGQAQRILFCTSLAPARQINVLKELGVQVFLCGEKKVDLPQAFNALASLGIQTLMLEGGSTLIAECISLGLADELLVYVAPKLFGGATAPSLVGGGGWVESSAKMLRLVNAQVFDELGGLLLHYQFL
jgi:2,5-diamino-6-(ribosylamino)-4(3H)-pyrimidinone 5'-phosphate reductase